MIHIVLRWRANKWSKVVQVARSTRTDTLSTCLTLTYRISLISILPWIIPPLNSFPTFSQTQYVKRWNYSNLWSFEISSLVNFPGYWLRKNGTSLLPLRKLHFNGSDIKILLFLRLCQILRWNPIYSPVISRDICITI